MDLFEALRLTLQRREWTDLVELLVIGAAVYAAMRFLRGTRGARLLRGFIFLLVGSTLVVYLAVNVLNLERIKAAYPYFVGSLFLIALVAFQPELRRALIRIGVATWIPESSRQIDRVIDEVVESTTYLSKNRIGALIAFERATEFGALVESGCPIDGEVTKELLNTIFWPGTALHDMGVIISQARVAGAAVQFPLTESEDLDPSFGSRHRAAMGLSQESDAVIVVVSEETGTISLVEGGQMRRSLDADTLRQALKAELGRSPEKTMQSRQFKS